MSTQVFVASTAFALATAVAALDDGAFEAAERRVLVLSNNAAVPETAVRVDEVAGLTSLTDRFDAVFDYNEAIDPQHPSLWRPRNVDLPLLERHLRLLWGLRGDVHLVVECVWVAPALTLGRIFADARIDTYADGLMSYGPTRNGIPGSVAVRIERLLHLDLIPGLTPVLLSEHDVRSATIGTDAFRRVIAGLGAAGRPLGGQPADGFALSERPAEVAVLLGQYLAALDLLTPEEELDLHLQMVSGAVAAGFRSLVFKPHPTAPPVLAGPLVAEAARLGATLRVVDDPALVETWFSSGVGCVIGCFSTALVTASLFGVPTARVGTELVLRRLRPYENSNRIPVTLVQACVPALSDRVDDATASPRLARLNVEDLVRTVSFCMQPERYPGLRSTAERALLTARDEVLPYASRRRLVKVGLASPAPPRSRWLAPARRLAKAALGRSGSERIARLTRRRSS